MGGSAFNSPRYGSLSTPRIPHHIYHRRLSQFKLILSKFYSKVDTSPPAPEKFDHGDIDILVEGPLGLPPSITELQLALNASVSIGLSPTANFAIWDDELAAYVQLDVHVCHPGRIEWECFHRAYGDLWNILGAMGKPFGISVNDTGVRISTESIEKINRKASMLFLTASPREAIEFFGCDWERFEQGFQTIEELFAFCAQSRFLHHEDTNWKLVGRRNEGRLKMKRPLSQRWVMEYLPTLLDQSGTESVNTELRPTITRESLLKEALTRFNKWSEYNALISKWNKEVFDKEMWGRIAGVLPIRDRDLGLVLRPLKARLSAEDKAVEELGIQAMSEDWKNSRESKWTNIALSEWEGLLEIGLEKSARLQRTRGLNSVVRCKKL